MAANSTKFHSIEEANGFLHAWAQSIIDGIAVSFGLPDAAADVDGVNFYLLDMRPVPAPRGAKRPPLQLLLRYLVTVWADDPQAMHAAINDLVFAAMDEPAFDVADEAVPLAAWGALNLPPRPAFLLRVPVRVERLARSVPLVREGRLNAVPAQTNVHGRLLVPNALPDGRAASLAHARVTLPGHAQTATSDPTGYFTLHNVQPNANGEVDLVITARGRTLTHSMAAAGTADAPVTVLLPLPVGQLHGRLTTAAGDPLAGARVELPQQGLYVETRADGRFIFDGVPADLDLSTVQATLAGRPLRTAVQDAVLLLTSHGADLPAKPVILQFSL
ncbi:MAG: hypothetical protein KC425_02475 [Anaerolineales bacterium]|nr:hypothetical protein [Anaerolineales bacterium]